MTGVANRKMDDLPATLESLKKLIPLVNYTPGASRGAYVLLKFILRARLDLTFLGRLIPSLEGENPSPSSFKPLDELRLKTPFLGLDVGNATREAGS
jgi:hypothetical protein